MSVLIFVFLAISIKSSIEDKPIIYDPSKSNCLRVSEPSNVCFVPKDNSANSPEFPPKNSAGTKEIGCLILFE